MNPLLREKDRWQIFKISEYCSVPDPNPFAVIVKGYSVNPHFKNIPSKSCYFFFPGAGISTINILQWYHRTCHQREHCGRLTSLTLLSLQHFCPLIIFHPCTCHPQSPGPDLSGQGGKFLPLSLSQLSFDSPGSSWTLPSPHLQGNKLDTGQVPWINKCFHLNDL